MYLNSKGLLIAADVSSLKDLERLVRATIQVSGVIGYKVGMTLVGRFGLPKVASVIRRCAAPHDPEIVWDFQKAGCDIPAMGEEFAAIADYSGIDRVILYPMAGPLSATTWIEACLERELSVAVGLHMTHKCFLESDGGWILDRAPQEALDLALGLGVTEFVLPGNDANASGRYYQQITAKHKCPLIMSPGLITQDGSITAMANAVGKRWWPIVGRAITDLIDNKPRAITAKTVEIVAMIMQEAA